MRRAEPRARREDGFTLPELMVAIAILAIIMVPLSNSIIVGLRTMFDAQERLNDSRGPLFTSAYFSNDVQSSDTVALNSTGGCGSGTPLVSFQWTDDAANVASYTVDQGALKRNFCRAGSASTSSRLDPAFTGAPPVVTCTPDCTKPRAVQIQLATKDGPVTLSGTRRVS